MEQTKWSFFTGALTGRSPYVESERLINCYLERPVNADKGVMVAYGTPGLGSPIANLGNTPVRAMRSVTGVLYVVVGNKLYSLTPPSGTATALLTLSTTSGPVSMTDDSAELMLVDGVNGYTWKPATSTGGAITDANFPGGATSCAYQDGFFIANKPNSRQWYASQSYDARTWTPVMFASKEQGSDLLVALYANNGMVRLFGTGSIETWSSSGSILYPFIRMQGVTTNIGVIAPQSIAAIGEAIFFLGSNAGGDVQAFVLSGTTCAPISGPSMGITFGRLDDASQVTGMAYVVNGHVFYILTFPLAGSTWMYDATASSSLSVPVWTKLESTPGGPFRCGCAAVVNGTVYLGDSTLGLIYPVETETPTENGNPVRRVLTSAHLFRTGERIFLSAVQFLINSGESTDPSLTPTMLVEISKDGGYNFKTPIPVPLGPQGQYASRVRLRRLGHARDWVFRLTVDAPIPFAMMGMNYDEPTGTHGGARKVSFTGTEQVE